MTNIFCYIKWYSMFSFTNILTDLKAVIAVFSARNRALTPLLVALWGRLARMQTRLERLLALWRAGMLPAARAPQVRGASGTQVGQRQVFPGSTAWLTRMLGYQVAVFGSQLRHLMTEQECAQFLAEVPQAGRILRPLLRMLSPDPLPEIIKRVVPDAVAEVAEMIGMVVPPESRILGA